jgi:hypothetical protein
LRRRVASYWGDLGDRPHLSRMVERIARVEVACASEHEAAWLERNLPERSSPRWNRTPGGQEAEVRIRLDASPRAPGLSVVHAGRPEQASRVRHFGPYLGGTRVRFEVGDGRLNSWRQYPRGRALAEPWLAATPPAWREFAGQNAVLAAVLFAGHQRPGPARQAG